jgi:predicted alpha/beta-hydrolase family hydrolase
VDSIEEVGVGGFLPLPLKTHAGRALPHTFYEGEGAGLLVVLPGLHYGPEGPVLYHLAKQLQRSGWDTLGLTYGFQAAMAFPWTDHAGETLAECRAALSEVLGRRAYERVGIVAKSLGTILLVQLCAQGVVPEAAGVAHLTPPVGNPAFDAAFRETRQPAYIAIGTRDSFFNEEAVRAVADRPVTYVRILEGADHGLDVNGDLTATLRVVGKVVEDTAAFFLTGQVPGLE